MIGTDRILERIQWLSELLREAETEGDKGLARQCLVSLLVLHRERIEAGWS